MNQAMQITIKDLHVETIVGCYDYERDQTQMVILDLVLNLGAWCYDDLLQNTIDYAELSQAIKDLVSASKFLLIESLAQYLAKKLLLDYAQIKDVSITIGKPEVYQAKECIIQVQYNETRQYKVALALGSNLNNPCQQLTTAIEFLSEIICGLKLAPFYKSSPHGFKEQGDFYNTCISGYTKLEPQELLIALKKIEKLMGKAEQFINGPRMIDIDIILFDNKIHHQLFLEIPSF